MSDCGLGTQILVTYLACPSMVTVEVLIGDRMKKVIINQSISKIHWPKHEI